MEDEIARNEKVANDQNEDERVREQALDKIDEGNRRLAQLEKERTTRERGASAREDKGYIQKVRVHSRSLALAVGTTIGVIVNALSRGLKSVAGGIGNGLKTLGKKIAEIVPGALGAIVNFVFRTAGEAVKFLSKHPWLLILAVAVFLIERFTKR